MLGFKLNDLHSMTIFKLLLCLTSILSNSIKSLLEVLLSIFRVFFGGVSLLFEELKFAIPKSLITIKLIGEVLIQLFELSIFLSLFLKFFLSKRLISRKGKLQLINCLIKSLNFSFG